jgi:DNA-binding NarL/FixJ family response regulator
LENHPFKTLWKRLLRALGIDAPERKAFELDVDLIEVVQDLAEREQRPAQDVVADLLSIALSHQSSSNDLVRRWNSLSPREQEVAALICLNLTTGQIATRLHISPETVKTHAHNILVKFGINSRGQLRMLLAEWDFSDWIH